MSVIEERASKKLGRKYFWRMRTEETEVYSFFDLHKKERMSEEEQNLEEKIGLCAFKIGIKLADFCVKIVKHRTKVKCFHSRTPERPHSLQHQFQFCTSINFHNHPI